MIERLTAAVVARLASEMPGWHADHFPDAPGRFQWAQRDRSLLVSYEGSTFGADPQSLAPEALDRTAQLGVTVLTRSLRGGYGMASALELVRRALFGWAPTERDDGVDVPFGWSRLVAIADQFVSEENGCWRFVVTFRTTSVVVAPVRPLVTDPFTGLVVKDESCR